MSRPHRVQILLVYCQRNFAWVYTTSVVLVVASKRDTESPDTLFRREMEEFEQRQAAEREQIEKRRSDRKRRSDPPQQDDDVSVNAEIVSSSPVAHHTTYGLQRATTQIGSFQMQQLLNSNHEIKGALQAVSKDISMFKGRFNALLSRVNHLEGRPESSSE